jgi:hypothetical protein
MAATITSIDPTSTYTRAWISDLSVYGTEFTENSKIWINDEEMINTIFISPTNLVLPTPGAYYGDLPSTYEVWVDDDGAVSNKVNFSIEQAPPPVILTVDPDSAITSRQKTIEIEGSDFTLDSQVWFNNENCNFDFYGPNKLIGEIDLSIVDPGTYEIWVDDHGILSNKVNFTVAPVPTVTVISPISVPLGNSDFTLTVNGSNFDPIWSNIIFDGKPMLTTFVSTSQLICEIPGLDVSTRAGTVPVQVFTDDLTAQAPDFVVI